MQSLKPIVKNTYTNVCISYIYVSKLRNKVAISNWSKKSELIKKLWYAAPTDIDFNLSKMMQSVIWHTCLLYHSNKQTTMSDKAEGAKLQ